MTGCPITAYSVVNALGERRSDIQRALEGGHSGLGPAPMATPMPVTCGAVRSELEPLPPSLAGYDTRQARLVWCSLHELVDAMRRCIARWGPERVGLIVGTSTGGIAQTEWAHHRARETGRVPAEFDLDRQHSMHATIDVARARTGVRGPGYVISTACSSSGKVLGAAKRLMEAEIVDAVLVGGVDSLCQMTLRGFHSLEVLSPAPCRPFSARRNGINLGEGGAWMLLEREGEGPARLLGIGETSDAHHMSAPHPEGLGARAAMAEAMDQAGVSPADVSHINAHATGTVLNDAAESLAIADLFADVPVVATKGYTGHLLGAAGATEAVFAVIAIEEGFIPASLGCEPLDPRLDIRVNHSKQPMRTDLVVSNSFAFGGSNVAVVIGRERR